MNATAFLLLAFTLAVAVVDWAAVANDRKALEYVAKPGTMVVLALLVLALDPASDAQRVWWLVAIAFSLAGDVFLMLPDEKLFVAGLGSFLAGHVAYVIGFWVRGTEAGGLAIGAVVVLVSLALIGPMILKGVRARAPELTGPVVAYIAVISIMVISAFGTMGALAVLGALLFYASDALIALNRFVEERSWGRLAIIVSYHLGQVALALSLV